MNDEANVEIVRFYDTIGELLGVEHQAIPLANPAQSMG
jgi:hypothetical protein